MSTLTPSRTLLIAHGVPDDVFHDRAFSALSKPVKVAYIGVANGDQPNWFRRVQNTLEKRHGAQVELVNSDSVTDSEAQIAQADVVYLAGGDVGLLANWYTRGHVREAILARQRAGATLIGVSAGAIGLAPYWILFAGDSPDGKDHRIACAGAIPFAIDCHDEDSDWEELRALLSVWSRDEPDAVVDAYGIPSDGALEVLGDSVQVLGGVPKIFRLDKGRIVTIGVDR